jgi:hypothetical protein
MEGPSPLPPSHYFFSNYFRATSHPHVVVDWGMAARIHGCWKMKNKNRISTLRMPLSTNFFCGVFEGISVGVVVGLQVHFHPFLFIFVHTFLPILISVCCCFFAESIRPPS